MSKSLIRKNQIHPDIADLIVKYGSGYFYPINAGNSLTVSAAGGDYVYATGDQTINGTKNFSTKPLVNGVSVLLSGDIVQSTSSVDLSRSGFLTNNSGVIFSYGNQVINGTKNFTTRPKVNGSDVALLSETALNSIPTFNVGDSVPQPLPQLYYDIDGTVLWVKSGNTYSIASDQDPQFYFLEGAPDTGTFGIPPTGTEYIDVTTLNVWQYTTGGWVIQYGPGYLGQLRSQLNLAKVALYSTEAGLTYSGISSQADQAALILAPLESGKIAYDTRVASGLAKVNATGEQAQIQYAISDASYSGFNTTITGSFNTLIATYQSQLTYAQNLKSGYQQFLSTGYNSGINLINYTSGIVDTIKNTADIFELNSIVDNKILSCLSGINQDISNNHYTVSGAVEDIVNTLEQDLSEATDQNIIDSISNTLEYFNGVDINSLQDIIDITDEQSIIAENTSTSVEGYLESIDTSETILSELDQPSDTVDNIVSSLNDILDNIQDPEYTTNQQAVDAVLNDIRDELLNTLDEDRMKVLNNTLNYLDGVEFNFNSDQDAKDIQEQLSDLVVRDDIQNEIYTKLEDIITEIDSNVPDIIDNEIDRIREHIENTTDQNMLSILNDTLDYFVDSGFNSLRDIVDAKNIYETMSDRDQFENNILSSFGIIVDNIDDTREESKNIIINNLTAEIASNTDNDRENVLRNALNYFDGVNINSVQDITDLIDNKKADFSYNTDIFQANDSIMDTADATIDSLTSRLALQIAQGNETVNNIEQSIAEIDANIVDKKISGNNTELQAKQDRIDELRTRSAASQAAFDLAMLEKNAARSESDTASTKLLDYIVNNATTPPSTEKVADIEIKINNVAEASRSVANGVNDHLNAISDMIDNKKIEIDAISDAAFKSMKLGNAVDNLDDAQLQRDAALYNLNLTKEALDKAKADYMDWVNGAKTIDPIWGVGPDGDWTMGASDLTADQEKVRSLLNVIALREEYGKLNDEYHQKYANAQDAFWNAADIADGTGARVFLTVPALNATKEFADLVKTLSAKTSDDIIKFIKQEVWKNDPKDKAFIEEQIDKAFSKDPTLAAKIGHANFLATQKSDTIWLNNVYDGTHSELVVASERFANSGHNAADAIKAVLEKAGIVNIDRLPQAVTEFQKLNDARDDMLAKSRIEAQAREDRDAAYALFNDGLSGALGEESLTKAEVKALWDDYNRKNDLWVKSIADLSASDAALSHAAKISTAYIQYVTGDLQSLIIIKQDDAETAHADMIKIGNELTVKQQAAHAAQEAADAAKEELAKLDYIKSWGGGINIDQYETLRGLVKEKQLAADKAKFDANLLENEFTDTLGKVNEYSSYQDIAEAKAGLAINSYRDAAAQEQFARDELRIAYDELRDVNKELARVMQETGDYNINDYPKYRSAICELERNAYDKGMALFMAEGKLNDIQDNIDELLRDITDIETKQILLEQEQNIKQQVLDAKQEALAEARQHVQDLQDVADQKYAQLQQTKYEEEQRQREEGSNFDTKASRGRIHRVWEEWAGIIDSLREAELDIKDYENDVQDAINDMVDSSYDLDQINYLLDQQAELARIQAEEAKQWAEDHKDEIEAQKEQEFLDSLTDEELILYLLAKADKDELDQAEQDALDSLEETPEWFWYNHINDDIIDTTHQIYDQTDGEIDPNDPVWS